MRHYTGERLTDGAVRVLVWDQTPDIRLPAPRPLPQPAGEPAEGAPTRFDWGHASPGAISLSRALLADCVNDADRLESLTKSFEYAVLRGFAADEWDLDEEAIQAFVELAPVLAEARMLDLWCVNSDGGSSSGQPVIGLKAGALVDEVAAFRTRA
jgi:hypothetical protein